MNEWPDMRLLQEYAEHGTEAAFTVLVGRHLAMVYQAALRQTRQAQLAEEVVQTVFTLLARKAPRLSAATLLSGWLYNTARFVATRSLRNELRRQHRLAETVRMNLDSSSPDPLGATEQVLPLLDELLVRLPNRDRQVVLARYFEGKSFQQVGLAVGLTEEAARKRVQRALEKLRGMLGARGVATSIAVLGASFEAANAQALPPGLSAIGVSSVALKGASGLSAVSALTRSTLELMNWTRLKMAGTAALAIALGIGTLTHFVNRNPPAALMSAQRVDALALDPVAALQEKADWLRAENSRLAAALAAASARKAQLVTAAQDAQLVARESRQITSANLASTNGTAGIGAAFVSLGKLMNATCEGRSRSDPRDGSRGLQPTD